MAKRKLKNRKIAIVGTAPSGAHAPFDDKSWEIWGCAIRADYVTRADRWFEVHRLDGEPKEWAEEWRTLMRGWSNECPVWMHYPENIGPKVVQYPTQRITAKFGTFFLTSGVAWMYALAIDEGVDEIGVWGVDLEYGTEYRDQRAGLRHFMSIAKLLGIKTRVLVSSGLAYDPVPYPLTQDDPVLAKMALRKGVFQNKQREADGIVAQIENRVTAITGAIEELRKIRPRPKARIKALENEEAALKRGIVPVRGDLSWTKGCLDELDYWSDYHRP